MASGLDRQTDAAAEERRTRIDLSRLVPFDLGDVTIEPSTRRVTGPDGASEQIEPRVMQVLVALARAPGTVLSRDDLIASCWGGTHVGEDAVSRVVVRARRLGEGIGAGRFAVETLPRVGYRIVLTMPEPTVSPPPAPSAISPASRRRWPALAAAALGLLALLAAGWWLSRPAEARDGSVMVGRLRAGGDMPPSVVVALDGELRARLEESEVPVRARGADFVVNGSVARAGALVHYTVTLDDTATGDTIATLSRDLPPTVPATAFARTIGGTIGCIVQGIARYPGRLPEETARLWSQYCDARSQGPDATGRMLDLARRLRRETPDFHGGWYGTAYAVGLRGMAEPEGVTPALRAEALAAARRFTQLTPEYTRAWQTLAEATPAVQPVRREALLRKAIAIGPERCGCAFQALGDFLLQSGRIAEAGRMYRRGTDQDRAGVLAQWRRAMYAYLTGDVAGGDAMMQRIEQLYPGGRTPGQVVFDRARWTGRWQAAAEAVPLSDPAARAAFREAMLALGSGDHARIARAGAAIERLPAPLDAELTFAPVLASLGRNDAALALLERSRRTLAAYAAPGRHPGYSRPMLFDPGFRPLYADPRFTAFLEKAGFIRYWRESHSRPDVCGETNAPPFCRLIGT